MRIHPSVRVVGLFNHAIGHFSKRREMLSETSFRVMFGEVFYAQTRRRPRRNPSSRILLAFPVIHRGRFVVVCTFRLSLYLSLSLLFREKKIRRQKRNGHGNRTHRFLSLKIQQSSFANEKKPLPPPCVCLGLSLSLSLSLGACARVRSSPRVNTNKARTIRLRISKVQNQTLNIH